MASAFAFGSGSGSGCSSEIGLLSRVSEYPVQLIVLGDGGDEKDGHDELNILPVWGATRRFVEVAVRLTPESVCKTCSRPMHRRITLSTEFPPKHPVAPFPVWGSDGNTPFWISAGDLGLRGATPSSPAFANVYGIPFEQETVHKLTCFFEEFKKTATSTEMELIEPLVLYHGTSRETAEVIFKEGRVRPSTHGMLGPGVYGGDFWKAARFAGRAGGSSGYDRRAQGEAVILRLLVDTGGKLLHAFENKVPCMAALDRAANEELTVLTRWRANRGATYCDERGTWRQRGYTGFYCPVVQLGKPPESSCGTGTDVAYHIKNEEYVVIEETVAPPKDAVYLNMSTLEEHHEPWSRIAEPLYYPTVQQLCRCSLARPVSAFPREHAKMIATPLPPSPPLT